VRLEGLGKFKKSTSSGTRTGDLPACSIVPQPTTLPRAPVGICSIGNCVQRCTTESEYETAISIFEPPETDGAGVGNREITF
jgi:hypothetical protein